MLQAAFYAMKIKYLKSILEQVDDAIDHAKENNVAIEYIQLSEQEYAQFVQEIPMNSLIITPTRLYRLTEIKVV